MQSERDPVTLEIFDAEAKIEQGWASVFRELLPVQQVRHGEFEWQGEAGPEKRAAFEIDQNRCIGDQHLHDSSGPCHVGSDYGRLFHAAIQLVNRYAKEFGGPGVGDDAFHQGSQTQTLEPAWSDPLYRVGLLVMLTAEE